MPTIIEHTGQHLAQLYGQQLAEGCVACSDYLTAEAEAEAPSFDVCPIHGTGCEAWS